jgi:hypothetical protein
MMCDYTMNAVLGIARAIMLLKKLLVTVCMQANNSVYAS